MGNYRASNLEALTQGRSQVTSQSALVQAFALTSAPIEGIKTAMQKDKTRYSNIHKNSPSEETIKFIQVSLLYSNSL